MEKFEYIEISKNIIYFSIFFEICKRFHFFADCFFKKNYYFVIRIIYD